MTDRSSISMIRFGTRGSALARAQTDLVIRMLRRFHPEIECIPVVIKTEGDIDQTSPLTTIGGRGVFTSALQLALRRGQIDAAVHSAKDLPSERPPDLDLIAFPVREDPRDVFVSKHRRPLRELRPNPKIGTSSRRRSAQIQALRPDAVIVDLRGNVDTRLRKALETDLDGIVIAAAGVMRMGLADQITEYLPVEAMVPSPAQGALAVEIRAGETGPASFLAEINDPAVAQVVAVERSFLRGIGGGCTTPVGALATSEGSSVRLRTMLASDDGSRIERRDQTFPAAEAEAGAVALARQLLETVQPQPQPQPQPLAGKRVLVTRAVPDDPLVALLRAQGAEPVVLPTIQIMPTSNGAALDEAIDRVVGGHYDWIVFTSGNAVSVIADGLGNRALLADLRIAAVGRTTAAQLTGAGFTPDLVPNIATGEGLVAALTAQEMNGQRVLLPLSNLARETVQDGLRAAGAMVDVVEAYRTEQVAASEVDPNLLASVRRGEVDAAIFLSPSSVHGLVQMLGGDVDALQAAVIACIGPTTAAAAQRAGLTVAVLPPDSTVKELVTVLADYRGNEAQEERADVQPAGVREMAER
jgi:hydroxymethylbilane synthase